MNAYMVSAIFADGKLCADFVVADTPEGASGLCATRFVRATQTEADLQGILVSPLSPEVLRAALTAIETGKSEGAQVLSLVRPPTDAA